MALLGADLSVAQCECEAESHAGEKPKCPIRHCTAKLGRRIVGVFARGIRTERSALADKKKVEKQKGSEISERDRENKTDK